MRKGKIITVFVIVILALWSVAMTIGSFGLNDELNGLEADYTKLQAERDALKSERDLYAESWRSDTVLMDAALT